LELVPASIARYKCPQMVIQFFEKHISWNWILPYTVRNCFLRPFSSVYNNFQPFMIILDSDFVHPGEPSTFHQSWSKLTIFKKTFWPTFNWLLTIINFRQTFDKFWPFFINFWPFWLFLMVLRTLRTNRMIFRVD
jgi:hypothetical protein